MRSAKKWIVSRISETRFGRASLVKAFGPEGAEFVSIIESATEKVTRDKARTDELLSGVVKMLTKVGLLWREGKLDQKAVEHLREPGQAIAEEAGLLLRQVGAHLPAGEGGASPPGSAAPSRRGSAAAASAAAASAGGGRDAVIDVVSLVSQCEAWRNLALPVLEGLIRDRNIARGHTLGQFYTGTTFVTALLCRPDLRPERERLVPLVDEALRRSGKAALVDRPKCVMVGCDLPRATIPGTDFCLAHHAIRFSSPTTLQEFLDSPVYRGCLADYLELERPHLAPLLAFLERCDTITSAGTRAVLHERTKTIVRRYVAPGAADRLFFLGCGQGGSGAVTAASAAAAAAAAASSAAVAVDGSASPLVTMGAGAELDGQAEPLPWGRAGIEAALGTGEASRPVPEPRPEALSEARFAAVGGRLSALDAARVQRAAETLCRLAETPSAPIRGDTFVGLTSTALAILDAEFVGAFPHSAQFRAWAEDNLGLPLPRISFARLRMLLERGVSVESITGNHVRQAGPGVVVAVTEVGTSAVGAEVGVPVSLDTGEPLEGAEREAALARVAHLLPDEAAEPDPEQAAAEGDSEVRGAAEGLGKLGSAGGTEPGSDEWSPVTPAATVAQALPEEPAPADHVVSFVV